MPWPTWERTVQWGRSHRPGVENTRGLFRPRRAVQTATRNSLPPGLQVAYFSFLKLQSHCRQNEALMLRNHSETVRHALAPGPWALPLISKGSSWEWEARQGPMGISSIKKGKAILHPGNGENVSYLFKRAPPWKTMSSSGPLLSLARPLCAPI